MSTSTVSVRFHAQVEYLCGPLGSQEWRWQDLDREGSKTFEAAAAAASAQKFDKWRRQTRVIERTTTVVERVLP